jgi:nitroreductase
VTICLNRAAVLILVANIERTSWKYREPTAYRVVFIEAGHIAQNICTIAVANGLTANPTAAISDFSVERVLRLDWSHQFSPYALVIGVPAKQPTRS